MKKQIKKKETTHKRRLKYILLSFVSILLILTCIKPIYPDEIFLQHIATFIAIAILTYITIKNNVSDKGFICLIIMLILHIIGARWNYSDVPYDKWINDVFGFSIQKYFAFKRNHYDRLVHFMYGFLLMIPISEFYNKWFKVPTKFIYHISFLFILASSMIYELIEWLVAVFMSADMAEAYNGQQGDIWDSQKDMAMAMFGAFVMILIIRFNRRRLKKT